MTDVVSLKLIPRWLNRHSQELVLIPKYLRIDDRAETPNLTDRLPDMEINIEDEETLRLAREVADLTGETMEEAITVALRIKLAKLKGQLKQEGRVTDNPAG